MDWAQTSQVLFGENPFDVFIFLLTGLLFLLTGLLLTSGFPRPLFYLFTSTDTYALAWGYMLTVVLKVLEQQDFSRALVATLHCWNFPGGVCLGVCRRTRRQAWYLFSRLTSLMVLGRDRRCHAWGQAGGASLGGHN